VTAIIIIAIAAIIYGTTANGGSSATRTVAQLVKDDSLVGKYVSVSGPVVTGSWDKKTNPMQFQISDASSTANGPQVEIVYNGAAPTTFGDGTGVIITGKYVRSGVVDATTLQTQCPSTYSSATNAMSVEALLGSKQMTSGRPTKVAGAVVPGSLKPSGGPVRFQIQSTPGGTRLSVKFDGGLGDGVKDGAKVVLGGALGKDNVYVATSVSLETTATK
jgi:cytochrome c-type biogenesis protein CcmE